MIRATLNQIGNAINIFNHDNLQIKGVSIDSRNIKDGNLFIAIKGKNFDGHNFIAQAIDNGARAIIANIKIKQCPVPVLVVNDTRLALGQIARYWREANDWLVVAITGSNGKTTVKEMAQKVLSEKYVTYATQGNLNNDFGVPLTLLSTPKNTQALVVEMGANHIGEISYLTEIVQPDIALVNNIGMAHIEGFGDIKSVAQAKAEIYQGLKDQGIVVLNADDKYTSYLKEQFVQSYIDYSIENTATVQAKKHSSKSFELAYLTQQSKVNIELKGKHNIANATAAITIGIAAGLGIKQAIKGLQKFQGVSGRLQIKKGLNNSVIIDDSYNANITSMKAGVDYLVSQKGESWMLVGAMAELGEQSEKFHKELASYAKEQGVEKLFVFGEQGQWMCQSFGDNCEYELDRKKLNNKIANELHSDVNLLIKGSRSAQMELFVSQLSEEV